MKNPDEAQKNERQISRKKTCGMITGFTEEGLPYTTATALADSLEFQKLLDSFADKISAASKAQRR